MKQLIVLLACPDRPGIVARVTSELLAAGGNVLTLEQHVEQRRLFFMRLRVELEDADDARRRLEAVAGDLDGRIAFADPARRACIGVLVTREPACAIELLSRQRSGRLDCEIGLLVGNEPDLAWLGETFAVPFHHVPHDEAGEARMLELLDGVDVVLLARYMKVLSAGFVERFAGRAINIHHSFLPSFPGARPYHRAWARGVKVIGATAHYVTAELDEGPIIAQGVSPVTHKHSVEMMVEAGRDVERQVLVDALQAHLEHRVIVHEGRTIVFHPDEAARS